MEEELRRIQDYINYGHIGDKDGSEDSTSISSDEIVDIARYKNLLPEQHPLDNWVEWLVEQEGPQRRKGDKHITWVEEDKSGESSSSNLEEDTEYQWENLKEWHFWSCVAKYKSVLKKIKPVNKATPQSLNPLLVRPPLTRNPYKTPITPNPPEFKATSKVTEERLKMINFGPEGWLLEEELQLMKHIIVLREKAIAFCKEERGLLKTSYGLPYIIPVGGAARTKFKQKKFSLPCSNVFKLFRILEFSEVVTELFDRLYSDKSQDSLLRNQSNEIAGFLQVISWIRSGCSRLNKMFKQPVLRRIDLVSMFLYRLCRLLVLDLNMITDRLHQTIISSTNVAGSDNPGSSGFDEADYSDCLFQPKISAVETFLQQRALQDFCPRALLARGPKTDGSAWQTPQLLKAWQILILQKLDSKDKDEINHQPSKKSQNSLTINNRLRQHQQLIKSHQLNRQHSQQNFLSGSKSEGMINYSPVLTQDEKLNLTACDNNSSLLLKPTVTQQPQTRSEEPQPSNQTTDPESIDNQSEFTAVSILSSQQMTVVNLQSNLQNSSSSSLPFSLRLQLSPTTRSRLTPKSKSTNTTKPTAIRPHTPDLTNKNWGGGGPSELSYGLPDPPSPISAFEINLSTQDVPCTINPRFESGVTVDPKPLTNYDLPQRTLTIQALPPSEHPESNRSNTPGQSWPENLPNHQLSSKLEIEHKDEDSEEEDTDDDF
ncbi:hypothetical protein BY996DRAFT_6597346 [Phakopsora pachyrhizi]|nr:hypothetical protein BY996DRAFT_6597346 [Phakopsora pachyrhizi]